MVRFKLLAQLPVVDGATATSVAGSIVVIDWALFIIIIIIIICLLVFNSSLNIFNFIIFTHQYLKKEYLLNIFTIYTISVYRSSSF